MFKLMDKAFGIRVSPREELQGLDIAEHGMEAYPDFVMREDVGLTAHNPLGGEK